MSLAKLMVTKNIAVKAVNVAEGARLTRLARSKILSVTKPFG